MSRPVTDAPLPDWMRRLAEGVATVPVERVTRFAAPASGGRPASVLVLFGSDGADGAPDVLLLQRASTLRSHAGQPAFPGGAADPGDGGPVGTALREAQEEVGLEPSSVEVATCLPDLWLPASGFVVTPVLGWWRDPHPVGVADPREVAHVARVPVAELADPANRLRVRHPSGYVGPAFAAGDMLVWGFTAGILATLLELGGWARPWDRSRVHELPEEDVELAARTRPRDAAGIDRDPDIPPASRDASGGER